MKPNDLKRVALVKITPEFLAQRLGLKEGIEIIAIKSDVWDDVVDMKLKSETFMPVSEGAQCPQIRTEHLFKTEKLYTKVLSTGLTYGAAIQILRNGDENTKVTRSIWSGYWTYEKLEGLSNPILIATLKDTGMRVPATPYQEDMLTDDWMVVE